MTSLPSIDYQDLFNALPERYVVFCCKSPDFTILTGNDGYFDVTDTKREEIVGKGLFEIFPDTSELAKKTGKGELQRSLEKVMRIKQPDSTGVIRYDIADGAGKLQRRFWQATHYPWLDKNGKCQAIIQFTTDVTALVQSEENAYVTRSQFDSALSTGLVGSWVWSIQNDIITGDAGFTNMIGVAGHSASADISLDIFIDAIHDDDRSRVQAEILESMRTKRSLDTEFRILDANKDIRWVIARGSVMYDGDTPVTFPGILIDVTSKKNTEIKIIESEQRLRFLSETMPQLVWVSRPDGYHEYFNKRWYEYTGTSEGETDGTQWLNLFHGDDLEKITKTWHHSLDTGEPYEIQYRLFHAPSKKYRWVIGRAMPYRDDTGTIQKWYGTCTDINDSIEELEKRRDLEHALKEEKAKLESRVLERTSQLKVTNEGLREEIRKRKNVEEKLRSYGEELKRSNKELEDFAYVSSHDLQEPLRKIQAFGDILRKEYGEQLGDGEEYLARMQKAAARMSVLIEDLLKFSRVTTTKVRTKKVDLSVILRDVTSDLAERISRENGEIRLKSELPVVSADETHMRQLFQNLISNALKFHKEDQPPVVTITARSTHAEHTIIIKDNGIGIDQKYVNKIFNVFQRLNSVRAYEGTGIGLAVCKKIVERYGGTIAVESQLGDGATFIITLPAVYED